MRARFAKEWHGVHLQDAGYNQIYRPDDPYHDLASAITFIQGNAEKLGIRSSTVAEGWVKDAVDFWKENMKQEGSSGIPPVYAD